MIYTDRDLSLCWYALTCADGWGEIDSYDVLRLKVLPVLHTRAAEPQYSDALRTAVRAATYGYTDWTAFRDVMDAAVKEYDPSVVDLSGWIEQMEESTRELREEQGGEAT